MLNNFYLHVKDNSRLEKDRHIGYACRILFLKGDPLTFCPPETPARIASRGVVHILLIIKIAF